MSGAAGFVPRAALALLLALALGAPAANAHTRSRSFSSVTLAPDGAELVLRVTRLDLSRFPPESLPAGVRDPIAAELAATLVLHARSAPCALLEPPLERPAPEGTRRFAWRVRCPGTPQRLESHLFGRVAASHLHFARVELESGEVIEAVLAGSERELALPASRGVAEGAGKRAGTPFGGYLRIGAEHIASGYDHLAFVLALLLLAARLGEVVSLVTAFTLAHSVTLALATLGWVQPDPIGVEALIGFSIALVAAENAWLLGGRRRVVPTLAVVALLGLAALALAGRGALAPLTLLGLALFCLCHFALLARAPRPGPWRAAVAFAFGLVHGFGFAGVLAELALPRARLVPALLGFNLGVELGQLAVVLTVWPALFALSRYAAGPARLLAELGSAAVAGLGVYWFLLRGLA